MTIKDVVEFLNDPKNKEAVQSYFRSPRGRCVSMTPVDHEFLYVEECDAMLITVSQREEDRKDGRSKTNKR